MAATGRETGEPPEPCSHVIRCVLSIWRSSATCDLQLSKRYYTGFQPRHTYKPESGPRLCSSLRLYGQNAVWQKESAEKDVCRFGKPDALNMVLIMLSCQSRSRGRITWFRRHDVTAVARPVLKGNRMDHPFTGPPATHDTGLFG